LIIFSAALSQPDYMLRSEHYDKKHGKPKIEFVGNLEHHGGKNLSQQGAEFFYNLHETRKRPTPGFRGRK
jgi:hypothetical protein